MKINKMNSNNVPSVIENTLNKVIDRDVRYRREVNRITKSFNVTVNEYEIAKDKFHNLQDKVNETSKVRDTTVDTITHLQAILESVNVEKLKLKTRLKKNKSEHELQLSQIDAQFGITPEDQFINFKRRLKMYLLKQILNLTIANTSSGNRVKGFFYNTENISLYPFDLLTQNKLDLEVSDQLWKIGSETSKNINEFEQLFFDSPPINVKNNDMSLIEISDSM